MLRRYPADRTRTRTRTRAAQRQCSSGEPPGYGTGAGRRGRAGAGGRVPTVQFVELGDASAIWDEFTELMNDLAGAHAFAVVGIICVREEVVPRSLPDNVGPDSMWFIGGPPGDPNVPGEAFSYQSWRIQDLPAHLDPDGPVFRALGQQWLVMVVAQWEHYRKRLADAEGVETSEVEDAVLADLTRMRNDVVHHRGIATQHNTGRCERVKWFKVGEPVHVMAVHVAEFMGYLGRVHSVDDVGGDEPWEVKWGV